jgi:hypothetical protein
MAGTDLKRSTLRAAIADALHGAVKAYELADVCVDLGLDPQRNGEEPAWSKRMYVQSRIGGKTMDELVALAQRIADDYDDTGLNPLICGGTPGQPVRCSSPRPSACVVPGAQPRSRWSAPRTNDLDRGEDRHMLLARGRGGGEGGVRGGSRSGARAGGRRGRGCWCAGAQPYLGARSYRWGVQLRRHDDRWGVPAGCGRSVF